jgi:hypothetical protein
MLIEHPDYKSFIHVFAGWLFLGNCEMNVSSPEHTKVTRWKFSNSTSGKQSSPLRNILTMEQVFSMTFSACNMKHDGQLSLAMLC